MSLSVDMDKVTNQTVQQLGGQLALLTLELNAQRAAGDVMQAEIDRLTKLVPQDVVPEKAPGKVRTSG